MAYDDAFFDMIRVGTQRSAAIVVPLLIDTLGLPRTVIDVGCGEGHWGAVFAERGVEVQGIDSGVAKPVIDITDCDLELPLPQLGRFDMALCIEVAEHLRPARAASFISELCALSDVIVFSAAIPGQGGHNHFNEQWPSYWAQLFAQHGFTCSGTLRWAIWDNTGVENWYRQNLLVAARHPEQLPKLFDTPLACPWPVVHPVLYDARR
jgi:SAM-dependent methyltransferase